VPWQPRPLNEDIKYLSIVHQIRGAIRCGDLAIGERLPTQRVVARELGVTISTVTAAYAEAARLHLVSGQVGRGTFVLGESVDANLFRATTRPEVSPSARPSDHSTSFIDLTANTPARDATSNDLAKTLETIGRRGIASGYPDERLTLAATLAMEDHLARRGYQAHPDRLVLTAGAQHGLLAALLVLAGPGSRVLAEELTFPGLKAIARHLRIELVGVKLDGEGLDPDHLAAQARRSRASVVVCVPSLHNPTGATMSATRREAIAEVLHRHRLVAIEDDVYGALGTQPPLAATAPERVVIATGWSKIIEPALRIGVLAGPDELIKELRHESHLTSWPVSSLSMAIAEQWQRDGTAARRIDWQRTEIRSRWNIANQMLGPSPHAPAPHRFVPLLRSPDRCADEASHAGVGVVPSSALGVGPRPPKGVRVSLTAAPDQPTLHDGLGRLAIVVANQFTRPSA
jgi:DNA-binding transcriptional MocR family regulator